MNVALPVWNDMVSPVLDVSGNLRIVSLVDGGIEGERTVPLEGTVSSIADRIAENAEVVICGALSRELENALASRGVQVHPWVMGPWKEILMSYAAGGIHDCEYSMPGCRGGRQHRCRSRNRKKHYGR